MLKQFKLRSDFIDLIIQFGLKQEISRIFSAKISSVRNEVSCLKKIHSTFDAKSVIVKTKIMPLFFFYELHLFSISKIFTLNQIALNFVPLKFFSLIKIELSNTRETVSYDVLGISLYLQLLFTKPLYQYYFIKQMKMIDYLICFQWNTMLEDCL